jgi:hypothetical protein
MKSSGTALLVKFLLTLGAATVSFRFLDFNTFFLAFLVAVMVTALNLIIGDLYLLPKIGNSAAAFADGVTATLVAWIAAWFIPPFSVSFVSLAAFLGMVALAEFFVHAHLVRRKIA